MTFKEDFVNAILASGKSIGAGLAVVGLAGAGTGVGIVFGSSFSALAEISRGTTPV